ncbi:unnamed protein product [Brassica oleracea]
MVAAATQIIRLPLQYCADATEIRVTVLELLRRNRDMMMFNEVDEGKIPKDSLTLQMLHEEMIRWPNLEMSRTLFQSLNLNPYLISYLSVKVEVSKKQRGKSLLNDSAAAIEEADETGVASKAMGYGALYLVSSFPVIIGISVVFILFYNSLQ